MGEMIGFDVKSMGVLGVRPQVHWIRCLEVRCHLAGFAVWLIDGMAFTLYVEYRCDHFDIPLNHNSISLLDIVWKCVPGCSTFITGENFKRMAFMR